MNLANVRKRLICVLFSCIFISAISGQETIQFNFESKDAVVGDLVCLSLSVQEFQNVSILQIPVKWDPTIFSNFYIQNEALNSSTFNIDEIKGELRYLWEDPSLENPISLENGANLFDLCFTVNAGKGMDVPLEIIELFVPSFEPLVIDGDFNELDFTITNGLVMIADDCNGTPIFPESICENAEFTISVNLEAMGLSISNFGYWEIDGEIVTTQYEEENFPNNSGNIFISEVNSLFDEDYNEEVILTFLDTEPHTFQYFYDFINCSGNTEVFTLQALPQPETVNLSIPPFVCYNENLIIDFEIDQEGEFDLVYSVNGADFIKTISSDNDSLIFNNLVNDIQLGFNSLTNLETFCISQEISPSDSLISVYDEFEINLIDSTCNLDGSYEAIFDLVGGSGDFTVVTNSQGDIIDNNYVTDILDPDMPDTVTISDEFCDNSSITFSPDVTCNCIDSVTIFSLNVLIECSSGTISPEVETSFKSVLENPVTYFRIYSKDNTGAIEDIIFDTLVYEESNPLIPFSPNFENGRTYFAVPVLAERVNGEINLNYRCLAEGQEIRFRYYRDPEPEIIGDKIVCSNQQEVKYNASTNNNTNDFLWDVDPSLNSFQLGNTLYIDYDSEGFTNLGITETYSPVDNAGSLDCVGNDEVTIETTSEEAPAEIELILFPGGLFSAVTLEDLCFQWLSIDKNTGETVDVGPETKEWIVGDNLDLDNLIYICIISNPEDGSCENSNCSTYNYFNSLGPVKSEEIEFLDFKLYPNPTEDNVNLSFENLTLNIKCKVFNTIGEEILVNQQLNKDNITIQSEFLKSGVYFVVLYDENGGKIAAKRFIKF